MSIFKEYVFPAASTNNIATSQTPVDGMEIILNGVLAKFDGSAIDFINDYGFVPRITFTSPNNISNIVITIKGYQNNIRIEENITGPNNNTVTSVNCFDYIENIIVQNNVDFGETITVGTSGVGYFPLIRLNTLKNDVTNLSYALNMMVAAANPATYQIFLSLKDSYNQGTYDSLTAANNNFIAPAVAANASALLQYTQLASNILIKVTPNANGTILKAQFMQL